MLRDAADRTRLFPAQPGPPNTARPAALQAPTPAGATATAAAPRALLSFTTDDAPAGFVSELAVAAAPAAAAAAVAAPAAVAAVVATPTALVLQGAEGAEAARVVSGAGVMGRAGAAPFTQLQPRAISSAEHDAISLVRAAVVLDAPRAQAISTKEASRHDPAGAAGVVGVATTAMRPPLLLM